MPAEPEARYVNDGWLILLSLVCCEKSEGMAHTVI